MLWFYTRVSSICTMPLPRHLSRLLRSSGTLHEYPKSHTLQTSDTWRSLNLLQSGFVKKYLIANDGSLSIQVIYGACDIFPLTYVYKMLFNQNLYEGQETYYYETMTPVKIYSLDGASFKKSMEADPLLYRALLGVAGVRLNSHIQRLENMSLPNARKKVAHQLGYYGDDLLGDPKVREDRHRPVGEQANSL